MDTLTSQSSPTRRLTILYVCALCSVAVLAILSQVIIQVAIQQQNSDAFVSNIAGRQRMLSQKISKDVLILENATDPTVRMVRTEELRQAVTLWQQYQPGLQNGSAELDLPPNVSPDVKRLFSVIEPNYQAMLSAVKNLLAVLDQHPVSSTPHSDVSSFVDTILVQEDPFLVGMDQIVSQYQREAEGRVSSLRNTELLLLGITLIVLLVEGSFVFRPTARKLQ